MRNPNLFPFSQSSHLFGELTLKHMPLAFSKALLVFAFFAFTPNFTFAQWAAQTNGTTNQMPAGDSCACQNGGTLQASLLVNGTFSAGYTGFSSGLSPNIPCSAGSYWVGNNFQIHCSGWPSVFDHTTGNAGGRFLVIDGDPSYPANIWSQPVNIVPGMTYWFSFWTASVYPPGQQNFNVEVVMYDNGSPTLMQTVNIVQPTLPWVNHSFTWTCPTTFTGPYAIAINQTAGDHYTDFGIDDICFSQIGAQDSCCIVPCLPEPPCNNTFIQSLADMGGSRPNIFPHPNGDFFATGLRNDSTVIVRFDPGGAPLWARAFRLGGDVVQISDMFVDAQSGDLIGVAYPEAFAQSDLRGVAFRYNTAGHNFVWVQYIPSAANTQIHALDDQTCVLTGITSGGYTHLMRLDKNTGAINGYDLSGDSGDYYSTLFNGTLYGTCRRYYDGFQASVFAHDPNNGAFLWQNTIVSNNGPNSTRMYPIKPVVDNDGITVLASGDLDGFNVYLDGPVELVVAKTSLTGDVVWTKQYVVDGFDRPWATAIVPTATGYYIVANLYQSALGDFGYSVLIKTDKQGQVQWAKRLGTSGRNITRNVMERNGFLYLTMASDSYAFNDLLLIKLDQNGETDLDCDFTQPISVEAIDLPNVQNVQNYNVFDHGMSLAALDAVPAETSSESVIYCSNPCPCPDLPISAGADTTICAGRSILLEATPGFDTYQWSPATALNDPASPNPVASPSTTTTYTLVATKTVPDLPVCLYTDSVTVTVYPTDTTIFTFTQCANEPIEINGQLVNTDQTITSVFSNIYGCDSVVITNLKFLPLPARAENISFCVGESVVIGGNTYTQSGTVVDTIPGTTGCDTVATYTLTVLPLFTRAESIAFCSGESVVIGGNTYTQAGTVLDTLPGTTGCDTVVTYTLTVVPLPTRAESIAFCVGASVVIGGNTYTQAGMVTDTIPGTMGCDTVVTYTLTVRPLPTRAESIAFCAGESVVIGGNTYTQTGTVTDTIPGTTGCDTVVTYTLTLLPLLTRAESIAFCAGESVIIGGNTYTQAGTVTDTIPGTTGCDTVVTYTLTVLSLPTRAESIAFCPGESVVVGGNTYTQPGTVLDTLPGIAGCDTVVTYTLHFLTPAPSTVTVNCPPAVNIAVAPGAGPTVATYQLPVAGSDCPCPGISLSLTAGLPSGAAFPPGTTSVCYSAQDSCGNSAACCFDVIIREALACDIKEIGCLKYELLTITADAAKNRTYRIRVTNKCTDKFIYTAVQLPNGVTAMAPANLSVYEGETGRKYEVRNPNYSPFYSIRFKSTTDSIANGQSDIFEYTLPAQSAPDYIHITTRLAPQTFYEAHLNTFNCPVGVTPTGNKAAHRTQVLLTDRPAPRLFPNPNAGELYVDLAAWSGEKVQLRVFNAQGQQVQLISVPAGESPYALRLPVGLADGLYTLHLTAENGVRHAARFVLQH